MKAVILIWIEDYLKVTLVSPFYEALQEFNVITSNAGPEYNRGGGAIVVTSTKKGGNALHGPRMSTYATQPSTRRTLASRAPLDGKQARHYAVSQEGIIPVTNTTRSIKLRVYRSRLSTDTATPQRKEHT